MVRAGCVFDAGIHPPRIRAMKHMCAQTRPQFILSSERVFLTHVNSKGTYVNSKGKIPSTRKFPQRRIEPATLWTASPNTTNELFRPLDRDKDRERLRLTDIRKHLERDHHGVEDDDRSPQMGQLPLKDLPANNAIVQVRVLLGA